MLKEFLAADIVVLGAPMYNFTIPSQLKAWIDRILVAGETFKYSAAGVEGLAGNKRVIVAISRGGFYGAGTPAAVGEHLETYLRWVFGFIGVKNPEFISADGIQVGPEHREKAVAGGAAGGKHARRRVSTRDICLLPLTRRRASRAIGSDASGPDRPARPGSPRSTRSTGRYRKTTRLKQIAHDPSFATPARRKRNQRCERLST